MGQEANTVIYNDGTLLNNVLFDSFLWFCIFWCMSLCKVLVKKRVKRARVILHQMEGMCIHIWMYIYVWQSHVGIKDNSVTYFNRPFPLTSKYVWNLWRHIWGTSKRSLGRILHCYIWQVHEVAAVWKQITFPYIPMENSLLQTLILRYPSRDVTYSAFHSVLMGKAYCIAVFKVLYC